MLYGYCYKLLTPPETAPAFELLALSFVRFPPLTLSSSCTIEIAGMMSKAGAASGGVRGERWWVGLIPLADRVRAGSGPRLIM
jgi:hypothetical protein